MADKGLDPFAQKRTTEIDGSEPGDFELMLRTTERVRLLVRKSCRSCAPDHLVVRIRKKLTVSVRRVD
jgi:hypothetical protein